MNQKERSIKHGDRIEVGDTVYIGRAPKYAFLNGMWVKVAKGIPFVKV